MCPKSIKKIMNLVYKGDGKKLITLPQLDTEIKKERKKIQTNFNCDDGIKKDKLSNSTFGRIPKSKTKDLPIKDKFRSKMRSDNIISKIKTNFFKFFFAFLNLVLDNQGIKEKFFNIKRLWKDNINPEQFNGLYVKDILEIESKKKNGTKDITNKRLYKSLKDLPSLSHIFSLTLKELFTYYYDSDKTKLFKDFDLKLNENQQINLKFLSDLTNTEFDSYNTRVKDVAEEKFIK